MTSSAAIAKLAQRISLALEEFAEAILASTPEAGPIVSEPELPEVQGKRQQDILALDGLRTDRGLSTAEVAEQIDYDPANAYSALRALEGRDLVELVPETPSQHWRLASRYRLTSDKYLQVAAMIREGEWATYGDISIAVRGDINAAIGVGRAAANRPDFPAPWRVLREGGLIHQKWLDPDGHGPEYARQRLEEEGVKFDAHGHARPEFRVSWDALRERAH